MKLHIIIFLYLYNKALIFPQVSYRCTPSTKLLSSILGCHMASFFICAMVRNKLGGIYVNLLKSSLLEKFWLD